jgi:hypothetical protein
MGMIRFCVPRSELLPDSALNRAYFATFDGIPWPTTTRRHDGLLLVTRAASDSGNFHLPWPVPGHGELVLSTGSLMERDQPYLLPVELARGTLGRLRSLVDEWQTQGVRLSDAAQGSLQRAQAHLAAAATSQHDPPSAADQAQLALVAILDAQQHLAPALLELAKSVRGRQSGKAVTLVGVELPAGKLPAAALESAISVGNCAALPVPWREIEPAQGGRDWTAVERQIAACRAAGLRICGGPLVQLDARSLPDWLYLWEEDEDSLLSLCGEFVREAVLQLRGKVAVWLAAARLNAGGALTVSEELRLRLAVQCIESIRGLDPQTPIVLLVDQPWGEFIGRQDCDLAPIQFADALIRADLGLAGIGLEINYGYAPAGTQPRDWVELYRQLDRWTQLGLPLLVTLCAPSSAGPDPLARGPAQPLAYLSDRITPADQAQWLGQLVPLLLSKPSIQGILWRQWTDALPHEFPHGGLLDAAQQPKPAVASLAALRETFRW